MAQERATRGRRRLIRRAAIPAVAVLAGILCLFLVVHTQPARSWVRGRLVAAAAARGVAAELGELDYNALTLRARITGVRLARADVAAPSFFEADELLLDLPWSAMWGDVALQAVEATAPRLRLVYDEDGSNLPSTRGPRGADSGVAELVVERLMIDGGELEFRDASTGIELHLPGIGASLQPGSATATSGSLAVGAGGLLSWSGTETTVERLESRVSYDGQRLRFDEIELELDGASFGGQLEIAAFASEPRLQGALTAVLDTARVAAMTNPDVDVAGELRLAAQIGGSPAAPAVDLRATADSLSRGSLQGISLRMDAALTAEGEVRVDALELGVGSGRVEVAGVREATGGGSVRLELDALGTDVLLATLGLDPEIRPSAVLGGSISARWERPRLDDIQLEAGMRTTPGPQGVGRIPVGGEASLEVAEGRWSAELSSRLGGAALLEGSAGGLLSADGFVESTLEGELRLGAPDLARAWEAIAEAGLLPPLADDAGGEPLAGGLAGELDSELRLSGALGSPRAAGSVMVRDLRWGATPAADVEAEVELDPGLARVVSLDIQQAENHARGGLDVEVATGALDGRLDITVVDLAELGLWPGTPWAPSGVARGEIEIGGALGEPRVGVRVEVERFGIAGQEFESVRGNGGWAAGRLVVDELEARQDLGPVGRSPGLLALRGAWEPGTGKYEAEVTGESLRLASLPAGTVGDAELPLDAVVDVRVEGRGRAQDPALHATVEARDLEIGEVGVGDLGAELDVAGGTLTAEAQAPALAARVTGTLGLRPWGGFEINGAADNTELSRLTRQIAGGVPALTGTVSLGFSATGDVADLRQLEGSIEIRQLDGSVGSTPLRLSRPGRITLAGLELSSDDIALELGRTRLALGGRAGADRFAELRAHIEGDLGDIAELLTVVGPAAASGTDRRAADPSGPDSAPEPAADLTMAGAVVLDVSLAGSLDAPRLRGELTIVDGSVASAGLPPVTSVSIVARLADGTILLARAEGEWQGARSTATGELPIGMLADLAPGPFADLLPAAEGAATVSGRIDNVTPEVLEPFVPAATLEQLGGEVSLRFELTADTLEVDRVRGEIVLDQAEVTTAGLTSRQRNPTLLLIEDGRIRVAEWDWTGPVGDVEVAGEVALTPDAELDVGVSGNVDLRMLGALLPWMATGGTARTDLRVHGSGADPLIDGQIVIADGELRMAEPRLAVAEVAGTVTLSRDRIVVERLTGLANGGTFTLTGELLHAGARPEGGALSLEARGIGVDAADGLRTVIDADLELDAEPPMLLAGTITMLRGSYREQISLTSGLLDALRQRQGTVGPGQAAAVDALRLDVRIVSAEDLLVDNNLARAAIGLDLRLTGTADRPSLGGRAELREGGDVFLSGNRFKIQRGAIDFVSPERIEPRLDIEAETRISTYDVTLAVSGTPADLSVDLSSEPQLDQSDLVSLIVTGRTLNEAGSMPTQVAREQVVGVLTAELSGRAGRAIGIDSVRIERGATADDFRFDPSVVAPEADPGSRLTIYKRLSPELEVVFSQSLTENGDFTWIVAYQILRNLTTRVVFDDDNNRAYELTHDLSFGRPPRRPEATAAPQLQERVREVVFRGDPGFDEAVLRNRLELSSGDRLDFFRWQEDRDRLERFFHERGYLEARVTTGRSVAETTSEAIQTDLIYTVERGPRANLVVDGYELSDGTLQSMQEAWSRSVFDAFLEEELAELATQELFAEGYLESAVMVRIATAADGATKDAIVRIDSGPRFTETRLEFSGNRRLSSQQLRGVIQEAGLGSRAWVDPAATAEAVERAYQERGMLEATVEVGAVATVGTSAFLPVEIEEGRSYAFGEISVEGVHSLDVETARSELGLGTGEPFSDAALDEAMGRLEAAYRREGFARAEIVAETLRHDAAGRIDVTWKVDEGPRQILADVAVTGAPHTHRGLIDRALGLRLGNPVDPAALYLARRRLYETGVFQRVDLEVETLETEDIPSAQLYDGPVEPVRLRVRLEERPRYRFRYGLRVNDDIEPGADERSLGLGASSDLSAGNLFGRALTAGLSLRYRSDFRAARAFLGARSFFGLPLSSSVFVLRSQEHVGNQDILPFITDKTSLTLEQRIKPLELMELAYSYNFERNHTFEEGFDPDDPFAFNLTVDIARLVLDTTLDARDDVFDSRSGWFHSSALEYSAPGLGSDLEFVKYLLQQYYFRSLRGDVVLASAVRLGLATAFDQELIPSERFFAGGGNSVRGYPEDSLGPTSFFGDPVGGDALLVLKQEVRFPIFWRFRGVGFVDAGNAFGRVSDLSLTDLKSSLGLGLRVETPLVLLRLDYGFRLGRDPGDPLGAFFFSVGQAF